MRVACEEYGSATPYLAFRHVFRRLLGGTADAPSDVVASELRRVVAAFLPDFEPFLPLLADVVDVAVPSTRQVDDLEPRFRRARLEHGAVRLLRAFISGPSALVFEDAHAMDEASASLLKRVVLEAESLPLLLILTRAPDTRLDLPEGAIQRLVLELEPLAGEAAARLAQEGAGGACRRRRSPPSSSGRTGTRCSSGSCCAPPEAPAPWRGCRSRSNRCWRRRSTCSRRRTARSSGPPPCSAATSIPTSCTSCSRRASPSTTPCGPGSRTT